jgi:hypothetical protein
MGHHNTLIEDGFQPTYEPDSAKAFFDLLGWRGTINIAINEGGSILSNISINLLKDTIEAMNIGISINISEIPLSEYILVYRDSPIYPIDWKIEYSDPNTYVAPIYDEYFGSFLNYSNPLVSQLISEARGEINLERREQLYYNIEENASLDYPFIPLYENMELYVTLDWVQGDMMSVLNPMRNLFQPWERLTKEELITTVTTTTSVSTTTTPTTVTVTTTSSSTETSTTYPDTSTTSTSTRTITTSPDNSTVTSDTSKTSPVTHSVISPGFDLIAFFQLLLVGGILKYRKKS